MDKIFFVGLFFLLIGCHNNRRDTIINDNISVLPRPLTVKVEKDKFLSLVGVKAWVDTVFHTSFTDTLLRRIDENYKIVNQSAEGNIIIEFDEAIKPEGYYLEINEKLVIIRASDPNGAQYGLTSLTQMYIYDGIKLPICKIQDRPKFRYRGMHLDVGRHMFTITEIKRYLDYLAEYKYNYFHWHLTEDQGWRIEIKKYPKLTEIGGFRKETLIGHYDDLPHQFDGKKYGGFYTQEQIKDIVAYAAERNITVVPEIEMPGHALAALAAYPHLGCSGGPYEVATKWGVFEDVFCPYDSTFLFLEDVLDEVIALFPSKYIHIGGDECPKESWKNNEFCQNLIKEFDLKDEHGLQSYFIQRIERYINSKGRQIIGWDEILEGGLAPNATVMSWRGNEGGINAANQDHDVIMTPGSHCYFDFYQSESDQEPRAIGGLTTVEKVYHWDVVPEELSRRKRKFILGGQANLWTEYIPTFKQVAYMAFARGMAMSEALWSEGKNYENFLVRYEKHNDRLTSKGYNIANHLYDIKTKVDITDEGKVSVGFEGMKGIQVECIDPQGELSMTPINQKYLISTSGQYTFKSVKGDRKGRDQKLTFDLHKGTTSKVTLEDMPSEQYSRNGILSLINGVNGSSQKFNDGEWLGFEGTNCNITFELVREETIQSIELRFFNGETQWIHLPKEVRILVSTDGEIFQDVYLENKISSLGKISELNIDMKNIMVKYIKILITNYGIIEEGKPGAGNKAWLFVDEVKIK